MIYNTIMWFADCPYFTVISGFCSMCSLFALIVVFKRIKEKSSPIATPIEAENIVQCLIKKTLAENNSAFWCSILDDEIELPGVNPAQINFTNSFANLFGESKFLLITRKNKLSLYACVSLFKPEYKCITNEHQTSLLRDLYKIIKSDTDISNQEFLKQIMRNMS